MLSCLDIPGSQPDMFPILDNRFSLLHIPDCEFVVNGYVRDSRNLMEPAGLIQPRRGLACFNRFNGNGYRIFFVN